MLTIRNCHLQSICNCVLNVSTHTPGPPSLYLHFSQQFYFTFLTAINCIHCANTHMAWLQHISQSIKRTIYVLYVFRTHTHTQLGRGHTPHKQSQNQMNQQKVWTKKNIVYFVLLNSFIICGLLWSL